MSQNSPENTYAKVSFLIKMRAKFNNKDTRMTLLADTFKSTFFTEHLRATDSADVWSGPKYDAGVSVNKGYIIICSSLISETVIQKIL